MRDGEYTKAGTRMPPSKYDICVSGHIPLNSQRSDDVWTGAWAHLPPAQRPVGAPRCDVTDSVARVAAVIRVHDDDRVLHRARLFELADDAARGDIDGHKRLREARAIRRDALVGQLLMQIIELRAWEHTP